MADDLARGHIATGAVVALIGEMTAFQRAPVTRVFPVILVTQIVVAVGLAPLLGGESWQGTAAAVVGLAASLAVIVAGAASLVGTSAVGAAIQTEAEAGAEPRPREQASTGAGG